MEAFRRWAHARPLALFAACYILGLLVASHVALSSLIWLGACAAALGLGLILKKRAFVFVLALCLGAFMMNLASRTPSVAPARGVALRGTVDSLPRVGEKNIRVRLTDVTIDGERVPGRVMAYLYDVDEAPGYGDRVTAFANTWIPSAPKNPGAFDYTAWMRRQRAVLGANISRNKILDVAPRRGFSLMALSLRARERIGGIIENIFPEDVQGIVRALVLGDRSELDEEEYEAYRRSGVAHLLALSGLHVGVFFTLLCGFFMRLRLGRRAAFLLTIPLFGFYALIVGCPPSVIRAGLMYIAAGAARLDGRPRDTLSSLSLAALLMLLYDPLLIGDGGFILSCTSVMGILCLQHRHMFQTRRKRLDLSGAARVSLGAQLGAWPATASLFHTVPALALPFNLVMITGMTLLYPALLAVTALGGAWSAAGRIAAVVPAFIIRSFSRLTAFGASMWWMQLYSAAWPAPLWLIFGASLFLYSPYVRLSERRLCRRILGGIIALVLVISLFLPTLTAYDGLEIVFLSGKDAQGAVVSARGQTWLLDAGRDDTAAQALIARGTRPRGVVLTSRRDECAGGLGDVVEAFPTAEIYLSPDWADGEADADAAEGLYAAMRQHAAIEAINEGERFDLGGGMTLTLAGEGSQWAALIEYAGKRVLIAPYDMDTDFGCDVLVLRGSKKVAAAALTVGRASAVIFTGGITAAGETAGEMNMYSTEELGAVRVRIDEGGIIKIGAFSGGGR